MSDAALAQPGRNQAFHQVPPPNNQYSTHDLSHTKHLTADMGKVYPIMVLECVPGDVVDLAADMLIRTQTLLAPVMDSARATIHTFAIPNRICWPKIDTSGDNWETFITGGATGLLTPTLPIWNVSSGKHGEGSLWDHVGLPTWATANDFQTQYPDAIVPHSLVRRAYNILVNEYIRDETLQAELPLTNEDLFNRNWTKDYFTSALPTQQRGTSPALPISGTSAAVWPAAQFDSAGVAAGTYLSAKNGVADAKFYMQAASVQARDNFFAGFANNVVNLSSATSVNMNQLRASMAQQQLGERMMVVGARYTEMLQGIWGTSPRDETLQRPEYIGGTSQPIIFSEVLQTSATSAQPTPLGNQSGNGISVGQNYIGKYRCNEFCYIISILTVMPEPSYSQGIPKMYARPSRFDWPNPFYANLSEQAVLNQELYLANDGQNQGIFGYQARFNELRYERSTVHGALRSSLDYWTLTRKFAARPLLNSAFIQLTDAEVTTLKRVTPVTTQPWLIVQIGNRVRMKRPIPAFATPGLEKF